MDATDTTVHEAEYRVLTSRCGVIDRSERGKLALSGADAVEFLNGQVSNELAGLPAGEGCYAAFLTHKGKMLGDLRILVCEENGELLLDTERVALQALFDMIRRFKVGYEVDLHKRTIECSLLSLVGPDSRAVAGTFMDLEGLPAPEHSHLRGEIAGRPVRAIATCQPDGIDVLCDAADRQLVWDALLAAGSQPVQEDAAEILRVEHGRPRYGVDLDENVIPQEAGLNERAVSFTKGCYVGQETVARLHYRGKPNRHLRGLRLSAPVGAGAGLSLSERPVGRLSTSVISPAFGPIGLALMRREAEPGAIVALDGGELSAEVVGLPFA